MNRKKGKYEKYENCKIVQKKETKKKIKMIKNENQNCKEQNKIK